MYRFFTFFSLFKVRVLEIFKAVVGWEIRFSSYQFPSIPVEAVLLNSKLGGLVFINKASKPHLCGR